MTESKPLMKVGPGPLLLMFALGFLVLSSYEVARSSIETLFEAQHGAESIPWAWLVVAPSVLVTVLVYNRLIAGTSLLRFFVGALVATVVVLALLLGALQFDVPGVYFGLYVWKDIYIVVLIELFWTYANLVFSVREARWLYGLFLLAGSAGAITGGFAVGWLALNWGTAGALSAIFPVLGLCVLVCILLGRLVPPVTPLSKQRPPIGDSVRVLRKSAYLVLMLLLIVTIQIAINLVDYEYKIFLNEAFTMVDPTTGESVLQKDEMTSFRGKVNSAINLVALLLQAGSGPLLAALGAGRVLMAIPILLIVAFGLFTAAPRLLTIAIAKITSKSLDYSLFRAAKEVLYIPLSYEEKTRGKAVIDIMVYRIGKAGAAVLILGISATELGWMVTVTTFSVVALWIGLTWLIVRRYKRVTSEQGEREEAA